MNGRYLYQKGDRVRASNEPAEAGTIVAQVTIDKHGERVYQRDVRAPHYIIRWDNDKPGETGFEHEHQLMPWYVNQLPTLFMQEVHKTDYPLWQKTCDTIRTK